MIGRIGKTVHELCNDRGPFRGIGHQLVGPVQELLVRMGSIASRPMTRHEKLTLIHRECTHLDVRQIPEDLIR